MPDVEDILLGGGIGIVGGWFISRSKGDPAVPPMIAEALERHKERVAAKIAADVEANVADEAASGEGGAA